MFSGHCHCEAIAFGIAGDPTNVVYCHCESCRRSTSSPFTVFLIVLRRDFGWTRGRPKTFCSSAGVRRSFCDHCGSPLAYECDARPDKIDLYACTLSDPYVVEPKIHVHADEQLPWSDVFDSLPRFGVPGAGAVPLWHGPRSLNRYAQLYRFFESHDS